MTDAHSDADPALPTTPDGYRDGWKLLQAMWAQTVERARTLPPETLRTRVNGEWSFLETLRHLVFASDCWIRRPILGMTDAYWPKGVAHDEAKNEDGIDVSEWGVDLTADPDLDEVLEARAVRQAQVTDVMATLTETDLVRICTPRSPGHPAWPVTLKHCLDVVLSEEWMHHTYAIRDLAVLAPDVFLGDR